MTSISYDTAFGTSSRLCYYAAIPVMSRSRYFVGNITITANRTGMGCVSAFGTGSLGYRSNIIMRYLINCYMLTAKFRITYRAINYIIISAVNSTRSGNFVFF
ncbi:MAG: hypothetical protein IJJ40_03180 [Clostridia bacterium]|nr:hypothetical protein [Clostridia bacterium]